MDDPLQGVTTKYLDSYLGWRRRIDRDGDDLPADRWLIAGLHDRLRDGGTEPQVMIGGSGVRPPFLARRVGFCRMFAGSMRYD